MNSVVEEIKFLRKTNSFNIDRQNFNRYAVVMSEDNKTKTSYFFTAPIYNNKTNKAVKMSFVEKDSLAYLTGTNSQIEISNRIKMENDKGFVFVSLPSKISSISSKKIYMDNNDEIIPTLNGVAYKCCIGDASYVDFEFEVGKRYSEIRSNDKYISLMEERFLPFITISCIGCMNSSNEIISPVKIKYFRLSDKKYKMTLYPCTHKSKWVLFEINLYEPKLMLDTTVESYHPNINNAFGGVSFIGKTAEFGEQWLYARPDFYKLRDLNDKYINSAVLHIPRLDKNIINIDAYGIFARFCSFGSNWGNKKQESNQISSAIPNGGYYDIDLKNIITDNIGYFNSSEGMILKPQKADNFSVISTGDSSLFPQILEVNYSAV